MTLVSRLILLVVVFWCRSVLATFEDGVDAYMRGDYARAEKEWRPLAQAGDPNAARNLARLYHEGRGVKQDYALARHWYEVSAKKCNATAQNNLGLMLWNGLGGEMDVVRAFRLFESAAMQGLHSDSDAMGNLATMYFTGTGTQVNYIEAYKWYILYWEHTTDLSNKKKLERLLPQVENTLSPTQKSEALRRVAEFRRRACIQR